MDRLQNVKNNIYLIIYEGTRAACVLYGQNDMSTFGEKI